MALVASFQWDFWAGVALGIGLWAVHWECSIFIEIFQVFYTFAIFFPPNLKGTQLGFATHCKGVDVLLWDSCASLPSRRILSELNEGTEQHNVQGSFKCWDSIRAQLKTPRAAQAWMKLLKEKCPSVTAFDPRLVRSGGTDSCLIGSNHVWFYLALSRLLLS